MLGVLLGRVESVAVAGLTTVRAGEVDTVLVATGVLVAVRNTDTV